MSNRYIFLPSICTSELELVTLSSRKPYIMILSGNKFTPPPQKKQTNGARTEKMYEEERKDLKLENENENKINERKHTPRHTQRYVCIHISSSQSSRADCKEFHDSLCLSVSLSLYLSLCLCLSLAIRPYHPLLLAGPQTCIQCPHIADENPFLLVGQQ